MRINEILNESKNEVNEAPVGFVSQGMKKVGAGIASKIPGLGNVSARMQGGVEAGNVANNLYKLLHRQLGKSGDSIDTINANYVANFLRQQGMYSFNLKGTIPLGKSGVEQAILTAVQDNYRGSARQPAFSQKPGTVKTPRMPVQPKQPTQPAIPTGQTATAPMSYGQVKQSVMNLKPAERAKLLQLLQGTAPTVKKTVKKTA